jgi:PncC family amidohydrolase
MESCTGGLVSNVITNEPGSSAYFKGGLVSYSNEAKIGFGVPEATIAQHGAVSAETAVEMATAAKKCLQSSVGLSVTGVAGPSELEGKPPGTAFLGIDVNGQRSSTSVFYPLVRVQMKRLTMLAALDLARRTLLDGR